MHYRYKLLKKRGCPEKKVFQGKIITQNEWILSPNRIPEFDAYPSEILREEAETIEDFQEKDRLRKETYIRNIRERVTRTPVDDNGGEQVIDPYSLDHGQLVVYMLDLGFAECELMGKELEELQTLLALSPELA